ncbi:Exocyst complex component Sec10, putative [Talaromyces stipitatus ATCC 10500]|uniref:Exocyst complex component Sec10, putative n=1 Tax=Talaromyces stipitatus (strain ATCC 10500 / CBS 375.48 / QM 6759 / NRRL 1006) TaxID=441959 RepID=B8MG70_TALSN|nr:Exocyst complex component Sec10, putative [Talaromyces stipitatus ATCC 10500]EED15937.1 Exocyst complex component Sec10, putative [Talaromyces stipitatus ATCC 10500]
MPDSASISSSSHSHSHSHQPPRTLYPRGPSFTLEYFSGRDYIVKDFIESLSDTAIASRRSAGTAAATSAANQPFDPKPLIRTFEHAQGSLNDLLGDLEIRENEFSAAVRRAEAQHAQNLNTLGRKLSHAIESFQKLDTSLNGATLSSSSNGVFAESNNVAVETGKKLEELERQRRRALDAHFLIECWDEVSNRGDVTKLETLRMSGNSEGKLRAAHIAKQLLRISQRLDPKSWNDTSNGNGRYMNGDGLMSPGLNGNGNGNHFPKKDTREIIEKFSETLEKDLLKQFDDFYRKANFDGMKECASVLRDFNGGASVIALFVNQHQFFIDRSQLVTEEVSKDAEAWDQLADPDADSPGVEPSLQSLVDDVKVVVQDESTIIRRAFPYYDEVLSRFLQRVFQQSIQQRLEMVLDKANSVSSLAFLRSLQISRSCLNSLVDDLKAHGLTEAPEPVSSQTAVILDQQLEDLFVPYFVGSSYIEREKRNLEELYTSLLFKFTTFHAKRKKTATTFMASLAKSGSELLASAKDSYLSRLESSDSTPTQRQMLLRVAGLRESGDVSGKLAEPEFTEDDGLLSVAYAKRMLKWLAEGVGRGLELSVSSETPKDVSSLLGLLLSTMAEGYIEIGLEAALDAASAQENAKTEPDFNYLRTLRTAISITHLMLTCINTVLIPLAGNNVTIRRDMEKKTNLVVNRIEDKINAIEQRTIDVALAWVSKLLGGQKKNDFRPKEDSSAAWLEMLQTPTCESICTFLTQLQNTILTSLPPSGSNLQSLFTELALGVRSQLLDHFRRFQVSGPGGLMVTKDMTQYANLLKSWDLEDEEQVKAAIDVLLEVGSLFVVGPEALREKLRGPATSAGSTANNNNNNGNGNGNGATRPTPAMDGFALSVQDIRAYVMRRVDTNTVAMQSVLNSL